MPEWKVGDLFDTDGNDGSCPMFIVIQILKYGVLAVYKHSHQIYYRHVDFVLFEAMKPVGKE